MSNDRSGPALSDLQPRQPEELLTQVRELRHNARAARHAYWFPLLIFGLLVCAAAPMYVRGRPEAQDDYFVTSSVWLDVLGGTQSFGSPPEVRGWYWLATVVLGALATSLWYSWHAQITGVATQARGSVLAWILGPVALLALVWIASYFLVSLWPLTLRGTSALLVIAAGLAVLSRVERSRMLAVITAVFAFAAALSVFYDPENLLYRIYGWFGTEDQNMPFDVAPIVVPLVPGAVLLLSGLATLIRDLRQR